MSGALAPSSWGGMRPTAQFWRVQDHAFTSPSTLAPWRGERVPWPTVPADGLPHLHSVPSDVGSGPGPQGLLGTDSIDGALWITRCNWVHCFRMRHTIDVVYVGRRGKVVAVTTMPPNRMGMPRLLATAVVEMPQGEASRLGIHKGCTLASVSVDAATPPDTDSMGGRKASASAH